MKIGMFEAINNQTQRDRPFMALPLAKNGRVTNSTAFFWIVAFAKRRFSPMDMFGCRILQQLR